MRHAGEPFRFETDYKKQIITIALTMEKGYRNLAYFFGVIAVITFIGFYKKYFSLAPDFPGLIIYDKVKKKQFRINPYTLAFIIWLIPNTLIIFVPNTALWQSFAKWMVTTI